MEGRYIKKQDGDQQGEDDCRSEEVIDALLQDGQPAGSEREDDELKDWLVAFD